MPYIYIYIYVYTNLTAYWTADGLGIRAREHGDGNIDFSVGDPSIWKFDGGPSIGERLGKCGVRFRRADNSRVAGWDQVRQRLMASLMPRPCLPQ